MPALLDLPIFEEEPELHTEDVEVYLLKNVHNFSEQVDTLTLIFNILNIKYSKNEIEAIILKAFQYGEALLYRGNIIKAKELISKLKLKNLPYRLNSHF